MPKEAENMEEAVLFSVENHVATITLNRPKSLNSMNDKLIDGLHEALPTITATSDALKIFFHLLTDLLLQIL